ncbi:hypothetical protein AAAZ41_11345 [Bacteroides finegoldii]|uniref:hypothetical protein n=1 Tax=Bacteroides finegoldii TaxID=338188 RepID=UPI0032C09D24
MKHLFFALGHGERTDFMQDFCGEYNPKVWRLSAKPARSSLATCPFFLVDLLKNECGAWLKIRLKEWFLCFLSFPLRLTKERSPAKYPVKNKGEIKKKSGRIATRPELPAMKQKENVMA